MRLGSSLFRRFFRRKTSAHLLVITVAAFLLVQWGMLATRDPDALAPFQVERLIASSVLADAAGEGRPEWERRISMNGPGLWDWTKAQGESAERLGFFPKEAYPSWALAAHWFGDSEYAEQLTSKIMRKDPVGRLVIAAIREKSPEPGDLTVIHDMVSEGDGSWREAYLLLLLTPDNDHFRSWMTEAGERSFRRSVLQSSVSWIVFGIGILAAGWLFFRRKRAWHPARRSYRLPSTWPLRTVLTIFFGGLLIGMLIPLATSTIPPTGPISWFVATILAYLGFIGFPAFLLSAFLTPGFRATGRLFGLTDLPFPGRSILLGGLALFSALMVLSLGLDWLWTELRIADLRHWLRVEMLDSHLGFAAMLVAAGIIAPLFEEIIFRGFLFRALTNHLSPLISAMLSSAVFATYHWYSLSGWITVFLMGLMFCGMTRWSRSLWPGILAHSFFNLLLTWNVWANYSFV